MSVSTGTHIRYIVAVEDTKLIARLNELYLSNMYRCATSAVACDLP